MISPRRSMSPVWRMKRSVVESNEFRSGGTKGRSSFARAVPEESIRLSQNSIPSPMRSTVPNDSSLSESPAKAPLVTLMVLVPNPGPSKPSPPRNPEISVFAFVYQPTSTAILLSTVVDSKVNDPENGVPTTTAPPSKPCVSFTDVIWPVNSHVTNAPSAGAASISAITTAKQPITLIDLARRIMTLSHCAHSAQSPRCYRIITPDATPIHPTSRQPKHERPVTETTLISRPG